MIFLPRSLWVGVCISLLGAPCFAQQPDSAVNVGRLFFTPQKRATLDQLRRRKIYLPAADQSLDGISLDGIVRRSSGKSTVWINGVPHQDASPLAQIDNSSAKVLQSNGKSVEVRVGESLSFQPKSTQGAKP